MIIAAMLIAPLAACGNKGDDKLAERVDDAVDNRDGAMDAIDAADVTQAISQERRDAIIVNEAAAVRRVRCPPMPHIDRRFGPESINHRSPAADRRTSIAGSPTMS